MYPLPAVALNDRLPRERHEYGQSSSFSGDCSGRAVLALVVDAIRTQWLGNVHIASKVMLAQRSC